MNGLIYDSNNTTCLLNVDKAKNETETITIIIKFSKINNAKH